MRYEDIAKIFTEIYIKNDDNEMKFLGKYYGALHEEEKEDAEYYNSRVKEHYYKNEALIEVLERIEELAKQSDECVDK